MGIPTKLRAALEANQSNIVAAFDADFYNRALSGELSREITMLLAFDPIPKGSIDALMDRE